MASKKLYADTKKLIAYVEKELDITLTVRESHLLALEKKEYTQWVEHSKKDLSLLYNPEHPFFNYEVAHVLMKTLRNRIGKKEAKYSPGINDKTFVYASSRMLKEIQPINSKRKESVLGELRQMYYELIDFLVQTPGNCWSAKFIYARYPRLKKESLKLLDIVYGKKVVKEDFGLKDCFPKSIFKASNAMHCAFCLFIDELIGKKRYAKRYKGTEVEKLGLRLRKKITVDTGLAGDVSVMRNWVKVLGLKGWVFWGKFG